MKRRIFLCVMCFSLVLIAVGGEELFQNPHFEKNGSRWYNWGEKKGMMVKSSPEGLTVKCNAKGLNQGIAQYLELKPGYEYEYSCRIKGKLDDKSHIQLLSVYTSKWGGVLRDIRGEFEWDIHTRKFTVPMDHKGAIVFRPFILFGPGELTLEWVSLKEVGAAKTVEKKPPPDALPTIKPVVHPKMKINLMDCEPVNIAAHINEKRSEPPSGASVKKVDGKLVIQYAFTTPGHDAVMFDLKKSIASCAKISMDITADGKGHRLFFVLIDANGESHLVSNPLVLNFKQRHLELPLELPPEQPYNILDSIWGGDKNQHLDLPLRGITIGIDDCPDAAIDSGTVSIKNLTIGNW